MAAGGIAVVMLFKKTLTESSETLDLILNQDNCRESAVRNGIEFFVTKIKDGNPKFDCPLAAFVSNHGKLPKSHQERRGRFIVHACLLKTGKYLTMPELVSEMEQWRLEMNS
jgi:hypothetical protein